MFFPYFFCVCKLTENSILNTVAGYWQEKFVECFGYEMLS